MTREELIQSLTLLKEQAHNSGANIFVWDINIDNFNFVIDSAIKALEQEPTPKNDLGVDCISRNSAIKALDYDIKCFEFKPGVSKHMDDIAKLLNTIYEIQVKNMKALPSATPQEPCDKCEVTFKDDNAVSRLSVRDIIYANAYELEYPDGSSEYVVNRDELFKYLMELPSVTPQEPKTGHLSIDDVMSVFDDFMCGEIDEDGTNTFLEMLRDKAESEPQESEDNNVSVQEKYNK